MPYRLPIRLHGQTGAIYQGDELDYGSIQGGMRAYIDGFDPRLNLALWNKETSKGATVKTPGKLPYSDPLRAHALPECHWRKRSEHAGVVR